MIVDHKTNLEDNPQPPEAPGVSTPEVVLSVKLPNPNQIYTTGSTVAGLVYLGSKQPEKIAEAKVSLVCRVRSYFNVHRGQSYDFRRETVELIHRDKLLWSKDGEIGVPPATLPFEIVIPDVGNDSRAKDPNTPLPPSFDAGKHRGWKFIMTHGATIGHIQYYIKVSVAKRGLLKFKDEAKCRFMFLPPSMPPPLLPPLPESIPDGEFTLPQDQWNSENSTTALHHAVFSTTGCANLSLWLPRVSSFPRRTRIPFFLCLTIESFEKQPPTAQLDRATLHLRQKIHSCARSGRLTHVHLFDKSPADNLLHGLVPQVSDGRVVWRGLWTSRDTPNSSNRQLSWEFALVAEVPIKGLGNSAKLLSHPLEISSGVMAGTSVLPCAGDELLDFPPGYFEGSNDEDEDEIEHDEEKDERINEKA